MATVALTDNEKRQLKRAGAKVRDATADRDRLIIDAIDAGASLREVAAAVGLSHMAVKYIARGR